MWHLTSLSLTIAVGIFSFDGIAFSLEPGTALWWLTRPVFYVVLIAVTLVFVAVFGLFEHDIDTSAHDRPMPVVLVGMVLTIVALSATAFVYLVDRDANITWWIPAVSLVAARPDRCVPGFVEPQTVSDTRSKRLTSTAPESGFVVR